MKFLFSNTVPYGMYCSRSDMDSRISALMSIYGCQQAHKCCELWACFSVKILISRKIVQKANFYWLHLQDSRVWKISHSKNNRKE